MSAGINRDIAHQAYIHPGTYLPVSNGEPVVLSPHMVGGKGSFLFPQSGQAHLSHVVGDIDVSIRTGGTRLQLREIRINPHIQHCAAAGKHDTTPLNRAGFLHSEARQRDVIEGQGTICIKPVTGNHNPPLRCTYHHGHCAGDGG